MKSFTDIEQSKKLVEILPIESADMAYDAWYILKNSEHVVSPLQGSTIEDLQETFGNQVIPCWSLTALLDVLPVSCDDGRYCLALINPNPNDKTEWLCAYEDDNGNLMMECYADNPIDACYEMALKLHERKML